jgi:SAM-dependent methyltransferase
MSQTPNFPKADAATAAFWNARFDADFTPWDHGGVPRCLRDYLDTHTVPSRVLIPGCGAGYEVAQFVERGAQPLAIDFSASAVARARTALGALASHVREADFFDPALNEENFDAIYERAFLCALPRRMWPLWARRVAELLRTGGRLFGFFFADDNERGPPFGLKTGELDQLLGGAFTQELISVPQDSIPVFAGKEAWQVWRRK